MAKEKHQWMVKPKGAPDAEKTASIFRKLESQHGALTPEIVLDEARKKTSPLHDAFEWDDTEAANRWRLEQARHLIIQLRIVKVAEPGSGAERVLAVRAYSHVSDDQMGSVYSDTMTCLAIPEKRAQLIENARDKLKAAKAACSDLEEFAGVVREIDKVLTA